MTAQDRETLLNRIAKLLNMAEGAKAIDNQHEAEAFAAKAQELMFKYKIEATELELKQQQDDNPMKEEFVDFSVHGVKPRSTKMAWQQLIVAAVARANFCEIMTIRDTNNVWFVGRKLDRQIAIYVTHVLLSSAERLVKQEYRRRKRLYGGPGSWSKGFNSSFLMGFATAIKRRLDQDRLRMTQELTAAQRGVAVVRIRTSREEIDAHIAIAFPEPSKLPVQAPRKPREPNISAFMTGVQQGESMPMPHRGLDIKNTKQLPQ